MNLTIKLMSVSLLLSTLATATTLATVNGKNITSDEVNKILLEGTQGRFMSLPKEKQDELQKRVVDGIITQELVFADAKKKGVLESVEYKEELADITDRIQKQLAAKVWEQQELAKVTVTDKEKRDYYKKNSSEFVEKEKVHARHILVKEEGEAKAIIKELKPLKGEKLKEKFIELAQQKSTGPSAPKGGDLGYFPQGQMVPSFNDAVFAMKKGTITTTPVKSQFGYHVIYLEDKQPGKTLSYEEVENFIGQRLQMEKFKEKMEKKMADMKKAAKITYAK
ncbi:MAG: peptidylprolyl isomerase [Sulfurimonas sp.]|nr:MAG: peptidylprolyl isomerase [Sulfurimonas sp.]